MPDRFYATESARLSAGVFVLAVFLGGCGSMVPQTMALRDAWPEAVPGRSAIAGVPFFPQVEYQCGPAALATALVHAGAAVTPADLVNQVYIPARQGSLQADMLATPRRHGYVSYELAPRFDDLLREVAAGNPVVVLQDNGIGPIVEWHYAVVAGYDYPAGELHLRSGTTQRLAIPFTIFEYSWKKSGYWAMVVMPPDRIPATAGESAYLQAVAAMERVGGGQAASKAYTALLQRWPGNAGAGVALANRHYAAGDLEQAQAVLRRTAERAPESVMVLNNLAHTLSDLGRNDEALAFVERAARLGGPFSAAVHETRALILRRIASGRAAR